MKVVVSDDYVLMDIFIGYDASTVEAYVACTGSIRENTRDEVAEIHGLNHRKLRANNLFDRQWSVDEDGQFWDQEDGRPFSTEFSFTRFCTIPLARRMGIKDWVMFCDSDFIFPHDLTKLFDYCRGYPDKAVMTVQFDWQPEEGAVKMDGRQQSQYSRKLWSSLMMINMSHPSNSKLTTEVVNSASGTRLHNFFWLDESEIGCLPAQWNWIEGVSDANMVPAGIHFSHGLPTHPGYANCRYATEWWEYLHRQLTYLGDSQNFEGLQP